MAKFGHHDIRNKKNNRNKRRSLEKDLKIKRQDRKRDKYKRVIYEEYEEAEYIVK